ncbi:methyl-accepting chemotaxis protein [Oxalobacteraceae bacterium]|nr:methyl-accepting chemotaxis protein [Oxalobacteraceae bacterium]
MINDIDLVEKRYAPVALGIVKLALEGRRDDAIAKMNDECRPLLARLIEASDAYAEFTASRGDQQISEAREQYRLQRTLLLGACVIAAALSLLAGVWIGRSLRRDLGAEPAVLRKLVSTVAGGDLGSQIALLPGDGNSVLYAVKQMQDSLIQIVSTVRREAEDVSASSVQISSGNTELSSRTENQASSLEQTAASMEEFSSTAQRNAENARQANNLAQQASSVAGHGGEMIAKVVDTMQGINDSSHKIAAIIGVIDSIAFQTNILALNAAVEAARAGDQGRGFAVVASEVRNLAGRSSQAAKEIKALISDSVERVEQGAVLVADAKTTMENIVSGIQRVCTVVEEISVASQEQSQGVVQVGAAISHMDQATQQNASMVEQMATAASSLHDRAYHLVNTVAVFKLSDAPGGSSRQELAETPSLSSFRFSLLPRPTV